MTDAQVIAEIKTTSPLNNARREFSSWSAKIDTATRQHKPLPAIEMRRMEFEAVQAIAKALGTILCLTVLVTSADARDYEQRGSEHFRTPAGVVDLYYRGKGYTDVPKRPRGFQWEDKRMRPLDYPSRSGNSRWQWNRGTTIRRGED